MQPAYIVEETVDYSIDSLALKLNEMHERGYVIQQVIETDSSSANGYHVIAHLKHIRG